MDEKFVSFTHIIFSFIQEPQKPKTEKAEWWWDLPASVLPLSKPTVLPDNTLCGELAEMFVQKTIGEIVILNEHHHVEGYISANKLFEDLVLGEVTRTDPVNKCVNLHFRNANLKTELWFISRMLEDDGRVVIMDEDKSGSIKGFIKKMDLLKFIVEKKDGSMKSSN